LRILLEGKKGTDPKGEKEQHGAGGEGVEGSVAKDKRKKQREIVVGTGAKRTPEPPHQCMRIWFATPGKKGGSKKEDGITRLIE